ncbi:MAG: hypothetical protein UR93_C0013G0007 [Berkelbacteria bacterium GW2011_GWA2_35_9]|uniref:SpoVT-AbrB domain-containing protein n=1 Tax=Berkelbacteria bacterium GW2011_GWA2_35_9 TaxID=1618333 RepID=A0A0G0G9Q6_9BACT|nr:MAG: hypothetical protein UR93_C0013G0007 [Berkelbacteria bacterium GW2011_GWA2_35_9]
MIKTATITSKRQLTIPASIFNELGLSTVRTMVIEKNNNSLVLTPVQNLVNTLAGSITIPKKYQGLSMDKIIENSKTEYFNQQVK